MRLKTKLGTAVAVGLAAIAGPVAASAAPAPAPVVMGKVTLIPGQTPLKATQKTVAAEWGFVRNEASNRCLEERPGRVIATGGVPCRLDSDQTWQWQFLQYIGDVPIWKLVNRSTGNCLDGANGGTYSGPCNGGKYQAWIRYTTGAIQHLGSDGTVLLDSSAADQGWVKLRQDYGAASQRWY